MSLADEIRNEIENIKELKITVGDINHQLSVLEGLTRKDIEEREKKAYQRGHDDGYEAGCATAFKPVSDTEYQRGLDDAWKAARRICLGEEDGGMSNNELMEIFKVGYDCTALKKYSAQEAIDKIKAYEDKQKDRKDRIEVGDEVEWNGVVIVITRVYEDGGFNWCDGISQDGRAFHVLAENVRKTGRHFDITSILEAMRE